MKHKKMKAPEDRTDRIKQYIRRRKQEKRTTRNERSTEQQKHKEITHGYCNMRTEVCATSAMCCRCVDEMQTKALTRFT